MKKQSILLVLISVLFLGGYSSAQSYNKLSLDLAAGFNKPMLPRTPGFSYPLAGLITGQLGFRYMFNSKFGLRLGGEFNRFKSEQGTTKHMGQSIGGSIEGVLNIGRMANFEEWTKHISLLAHGGAGIHVLSDASSVKIPGKDKFGSIVFGVTPMFKLSNRISLMTDLSVHGNFRQNNAFDFNSPQVLAGLDGYYATATIGLSIYLGKNASHMDWKFEGDELMKRIEALEADLENTKGDVDLLGKDVKALEEKMQDDDNDGVANYLDIEPNTPEGETVNTKGQTVKVAPVKDLMDNAEGLFYTVQLGVFSSQIPEQYWKGITPLYRLTNEDGTTRYFSGVFHSVDEARPKLATAKGNGLVDSFITAYYRGKRITVAEADLILSTRGAEALRPKP
jgi:OOP family OmpA-OmpF porin